MGGFVHHGLEKSRRTKWYLVLKADKETKCTVKLNIRSFTAPYEFKADPCKLEKSITGRILYEEREEELERGLFSMKEPTTGPDGPDKHLELDLVLNQIHQLVDINDVHTSFTTLMSVTCENLQDTFEYAIVNQEMLDSSSNKWSDLGEILLVWISILF